MLDDTQDAARDAKQEANPPLAAGQIETRSGLRLAVRGAEPSDKPALAAFFRRVSPEDLRFRFLSAVREVGDDRLVEMTSVDHVRTEDFLAFDAAGAIVAAAMLAIDPSRERAEVAISVRADQRGKGIGWSLLRFVADQARARGVRQLQSVESRANFAAIQLQREMGFACRSHPDDPTLMIVSLDLR
jgi:acetyltransferase